MSRERRPRERFRGPRLVVRVPGALRARSTVFIAFLALVLGAILAAAVSAIGYALAGLLHSVSNGS